MTSLSKQHIIKKHNILLIKRISRHKAIHQLDRLRHRYYDTTFPVVGLNNKTLYLNNVDTIEYSDYAFGWKRKDYNDFAHKLLYFIASCNKYDYYSSYIKEVLNFLHLKDIKYLVIQTDTNNYRNFYGGINKNAYGLLNAFLINNNISIMEYLRNRNIHVVIDSDTL